jgi:hypothetical protein
MYKSAESSHVDSIIPAFWRILSTNNIRNEICVKKIHSKIQSLSPHLSGRSNNCNSIKGRPKPSDPSHSI